jgi:hypothetical protein
MRLIIIDIVDLLTFVYFSLLSFNVETGGDAAFLIIWLYDKFRF